MEEARGRVAVYCNRCGKVDDHPRHTHALSDGTIVDYHFDCCLCEICTSILDRADGKRGLELAEHIINGGADHVNYSAREK